MQEASMNCPKCEAEMEEGFVGDSIRHQVVAPFWYSGAFKISFWGGLGLRKRKRYYVQTWRCTGCGYLESYAL